jgi:dipeptidyl aminopeptidase/acylaminoacyl peptidase
VTRLGRTIIRTARRTRVATPESWPEPWPDTPAVAAGKVRTPLLVIHGDIDHYFPLEHPKAIEREARIAGTDVELWIEPGMGHAESATTDALVARIIGWVRAHVGVRS